MPSKRYTLSFHYDYGYSHHYDLFLEKDGRLLTFGIDSISDTQQIAVSAKKDHRLLYLDYEGPITGKGFTSVIMSGMYRSTEKRCIMRGLGYLDKTKGHLRISSAAAF